MYIDTVKLQIQSNLRQCIVNNAHRFFVTVSYNQVLCAYETNQVAIKLYRQQARCDTGNLITGTRYLFSTFLIHR